MLFRSFGAHLRLIYCRPRKGLISQVDGHLNALDLDATNSDERRQKKILAIEEIDLFEKTTLLELRNAFE